MKHPITNQPSLREAGMRGCLAHANAAVAAGALAVLLLGILAASAGPGPASPAHTRPIEDFIEAQGAFAVNLPPEALSTVLASGWTDRKTVRFASVDCWGLVNKWIEEQSDISLGTEIEGTVRERPLPEGRAEVTVLLHTKNALVWAAELVEAPPPDAPPFGDLLFGHLPEEILAGAAPALGESLFKWVFINEAPGAPLPDLLAEGLAGPTVETLMISIEAHADGSFREASGEPEGAPGKAQITQTGRLLAPGLDATLTSGKWPAEHINLKAVGR